MIPTDVLMVWGVIGWAVIILAQRPGQVISGLIFQAGVIVMLIAKQF